MAKIIVSALAFLLLFSVGMANAQSISLDNVEGLVSGTDNVVETGVPVTFNIRAANNGSETVTGFTTGFRTYSPDGATWTTTVGDTTSAVGKDAFDQIFINGFGVDGAGADTIGFGAFLLFAPGLPPGFDAISFKVQVGPIDASHEGKQICLDSSFFPPGGEWLWSTGSSGVAPTWDGPHCFYIGSEPPAGSNFVIDNTSLNFTAEEGSTDPAAQTFNVTSDNEPIDFTLTEDAAWFVTEPVSGGTTPQEVSVNVSIAGLEDGSYVDTITVAGDAENSPQYVVVNLTVTPAPINLVVNPTSLAFTATEGGANPAPQTFVVGTDGDPAAFNIIETSPWIATDITTGTTPDTVTTSIDITGVTEGVYYDTITVFAPTTENTQVDVEVMLTVEAASVPTITSVDPNVGYQGEGLTVTITGENTTFGSGSVTGVTLTENTTTFIGTDVNVVSPTEITVNFDFPNDAPLGAYDLTVLEDGSMSIMAMDAFEIRVGSNLAVGITEINFTAVEGGAFPDPVMFAVSSDNRPLDFIVYKFADWLSVDPTQSVTPDTVGVYANTTGLTPGMYYDTIQVVAPSALNDVFFIGVTLEVTAASEPTIVSVAPDSAYQGDNLTVTITGDNTNFGQGSVTTVTFTPDGGGPSIAATGISVSSATELTANLAIPTDATLGQYDVAVSEDGGAPVVGENLFTVIEAAPQPTALLQVIHNAADPGVDVVDIYVNNALFLPNFAFRTATEFVEVPAEVTLNIGVAPGNSVDSNDIIATIPVVLTEGETYVAIANGVLDTTQFVANPDGHSIAFNLYARDGIRTAGTTGDVDFLAFHGATDAPGVDVLARGAGVLVDNAFYGDYSPYLSVPPAEYILDVTPAEDNGTVVASFTADLSGLGGGAAVVFASGFLDPTMNQNGEAFGLFAALPTGDVVAFPPVVTEPTIVSVVPDSGYQGENLSVTITGENTEFGQGSVTEVQFVYSGLIPASIPVSNVNVVSMTEITCDLAIPLDAELGDYDVTVTEDGGDPVTGLHLFTVRETIAIEVNLFTDPTELSFTLDEGAGTEMKPIIIGSTEMSVGFTLSDTTDWLEVTAYSGETPDTAYAEVDVTGLAPGMYYGGFYVESTEAMNSPLWVPVTLTVEEVVTPGDGAVSLDAVTSGYLGGDSIATGEVITFDFRYTNNTGAPITGITNGFMVYSSTGAEWTTTTLDTVGTLGKTQFDGGVFINEFSITGSGADTVGLGGFALLGPGMPGDFDDVAARIQIGPIDNMYDGGQICIDSTWYPPAGEWLWSDGSNPVTVQWDGPHCFTIVGGGVEPQLVATPDMLEFTAEIGGPNPAGKGFVISEAMGEPVAYDLTVVAPWIAVDPASGTTPDSIMVNVDITGVPVGVYIDSIMATIPGAGREPVYVTVQLTVEGAPSGADSLIVGTEPGVPGSQVIVPVEFTNTCSLWAATAVLGWNGDIMLDSVTFDGLATEGMSVKMVEIENSSKLMYVNLEAASIGEAIPSGKHGFMDMYFTLDSDLLPGFYEIYLADMPAGVFGGTIPPTNLEFLLDCGFGGFTITPIFYPGGIVVDTSANYVCGHVVDDMGDPIANATVELWNDFPGVGPALTTTTNMNGFFEFVDFTINPFDLYAYKDGYYPNSEEGLMYGESGIVIELTPVPDIYPTYEWVNFYCSNNLYFDAPLPVGSVVDAYDPDGVRCGSFTVTEAGQYGFMPVYRDDPYEDGDQGAEPGDVISFYINGSPATAYGDHIWTENGDAFEVCLEAGLITKTCDLVEGWNLVSWNVDTDSDAILDVLASIDGCYSLVLGFEQGGLTYDPTLPEFSTLWSADHMSGYWIKMTCDTSITLTGYAVPASTPIPLTTGWNLVSYLPEMTMATEDALVSVADYLRVALGFDGAGLVYEPGQGQFNTLNEMSSCYGYWVKVNAAVDLVYPEMTPVLIPSLNRNTAQPLAKVVAGDVAATTEWINVYSHNLMLDGNTVEAGATIAAFTTEGEKVGSYTVGENGKFGFMPVYVDDPATEGVEGVAYNGEFYFEINGVRTNETFAAYGRGQKVEVFNLTASSEPGELPQTYSLSQNYPNPFNPSTTIEFSMANAGHAKVEVFNLLGQLVATPFDAQAVQGFNQVTWDGRNEAGEAVSSGVYFYRLTADNYSETKKMTLLK